MQLDGNLPRQASKPWQQGGVAAGKEGRTGDGALAA